VDAGAGEMIEIPLTQGQVALIDDEDWELVSQYKWRALWDRCTKSFYAIANVYKPDGKRTTLKMHRLIKGAKKGEQVDHIHHNTLDNRQSETRLCTGNQNARNAVKRADNTSGFKGVCWSKRHQKWEAKIKLNGKRKHLGYYHTPELGHAAYCKAALELHGEFARTS
jgi:hypothetical protein